MEKSYRMTKLMSNLNLMTKATTMKMKRQQILLMIMKKKKTTTANQTLQAPVILVDLCEENNDIKNDAMFLDTLGTLLSTTQTSHH